MQHQKVKIFYFPKADIVKERLKLAEFKRYNTVLRVKHIKSAGCDDKVIKVIYVPIENNLINKKDI